MHTAWPIIPFYILPYLLCVAVPVYLAAVVIYRLNFSPSARFPGPRLAALTFLYEGYYDVWHRGQYTWKIKELHEQYGKRMPSIDCGAACGNGTPRNICSN